MTMVVVGSKFGKRSSWRKSTNKRKVFAFRLSIFDRCCC